MSYRLSDRQNDIISLLHKNKSFSVDKLSQYFNVTPTTIRRDLTVLKEYHLIDRSHGFAFIPEKEDSLFETRVKLNNNEKELLAAQALKYIHPGETLILDSGTTILALAKKIYENEESYDPLSIVTDSLPIVSTFYSSDTTGIMIPGGVLDKHTLSIIGPEAEEFFNPIVADKFFMGATGVHMPMGFTTYSPFHTALKKKMISCSSEVIAVIDSSKFSIRSTHVFCQFEEITRLITTRTDENEAFIDDLIKRGIKVDCIEMPDV